jgi:hypothetical protein
MLSWLDTRKAKAAGVALAERLTPHTIEMAAPAKQQKRALQDVLQHAQRQVLPLHLNFLQRASFANAFKWALLDKGVERPVADEITQTLVTHLFLRKGS